MTLDEIFSNDDMGLFKQEVTEYKGWTITKDGKQGYGYEVRNPEGYLSLETSINGTLEECKSYIDSAVSFKAVK